MSIIIRRASNPFWDIRPPKEMSSNPLGYSCAPNAADCHYAGAGNIEDFIAFGFQVCWLSPDDFGDWERLERDDIQWLREYFLRTLENSLLLIYTGEIELEPGKPFDQFESSSYNSLTIGDNDENPKDDETMLFWQTHSIGTDGCICMDFCCHVLAGEGTDGEPYSIFLDKEGYANKARVRAAIAMARRVNGLMEDCDHGVFKILDEDKWTAGQWDTLGVVKVKIPDKVTDVNTFGKWVDNTGLGENDPPFVPGNVVEEDVSGDVMHFHKDD